jgi:hypothetical protein
MNERYKPKPPIIRALLLEHSDGLSVSDICARTGIDIRVARDCLKKMADAYIDRWILGRHQCPPEAIWCVVHVPEDCPRPTRKK